MQLQVENITDTELDDMLQLLTLEKDKRKLHSTESHPNYEYKTRKGPRKSFDDEDVPPKGDGWERNIYCGRHGWERFDYHEESYWMRKKLAKEN